MQNLGTMGTLTAEKDVKTSFTAVNMSHVAFTFCVYGTEALRNKLFPNPAVLVFKMLSSCKHNVPQLGAKSQVEPGKYCCSVYSCLLYKVIFNL